MSQKCQLDRFEIRLSGTGGQGILTLGRMLGHGLAIGHGYFVTQTQSYGPEARGGSSRSDLVISSSPISYPKTEKVDLLAALSQEAVNSYYQSLKPGGVLLVDESSVRQVPINNYLGLPFTELARDKIKVPQALNTIVLGAISALLPFASKSVMRRSMEMNLPEKIRELNVRAFTLGFSQAAKRFGPPKEQWCSIVTEDNETDTSLRAV